MSRFHTLKVGHIERLTPEAVQIEFQIPDSLAEEFHFEAGQYLTIKHLFNGEEIRRDYSICSSPNHTNRIQVGVKEVKNGAFSTFANNELQAGSTLEVMQPQGRFTFTGQADRQANYAAIAAGSGITPVLSIITNALETETKSSFLLIYGNRNEEQTMFLPQIQALQQKYPDRFHLEMVYSQQKVEDARFGRIDRSIINFFLKNKYKEYTVDTYFLCGPGDLIEQTKDILIEGGAAKSNIRFELFTSSQEAETIMTEGSTKITVTLDGQDTEFIMNQENLVLDSVLEEGLDAPYSCRGGICSTCMALVTEGKAKMRKNQILTDEEVAEGYILTCQSQPITPTLKVDYDDV